MVRDRTEYPGQDRLGPAEHRLAEVLSRRFWPGVTKCVTKPVSLDTVRRTELAAAMRPNSWSSPAGLHSNVDAIQVLRDRHSGEFFVGELLFEPLPFDVGWGCAWRTMPGGTRSVCPPTP